MKKDGKKRTDAARMKMSEYMEETPKVIRKAPPTKFPLTMSVGEVKYQRRYRHKESSRPWSNMLQVYGRRRLAQMRGEPHRRLRCSPGTKTLQARWPASKGQTGDLGKYGPKRTTRVFGRGRLFMRFWP